MSNEAKILVIRGRRPGSVDGRPVIDPELRAARARWLLIVLAACGLALFALGALVSEREDSASIRKLAQDARHRLFVHTQEEVETICREPAADSGALRDHCIAQARFLLELPECAEACRRSADVILPHAHR